MIKLMWVMFVVSTGMDVRHGPSHYMGAGTHMFATQEECLRKADELRRRRHVKVACEQLPFLIDAER
jgi:hypothetical protein